MAKAKIITRGKSRTVTGRTPPAIYDKLSRDIWHVLLRICPDLATRPDAAGPINLQISGIAKRIEIANCGGANV